MAQIDSLEIEISTSAVDAVRHIDALSQSLNRLRTATSGGLGNLRGIATGLRGISESLRGLDISTRNVRALADLMTALRDLDGVRISPNIANSLNEIVQAVENVPNGVAARLRSMAESIERLARATHGGNGHIRLNVQERGVRETTRRVGVLANIWNSLRRIAFYRMIRSAIKAVTETLQEGTQNVYKWSAAFESHMNGVKTIAEAYDSLSSASYKMGNQLGAAWASLIRAIEPVLIQLLGLITRVANAITQLFALLGGKTTYLKAIDYSKKWGDTTAAGAKAAQEWKNQLMGFDVINRLEEPSSGGGGGGAALPDIGSMFEETPINAKLADAFGAIKEIITSNIAEIEFILGGAALGVGAILLFSGANIPLGLGLMVAGAARLYATAKENWGFIDGKIGIKLSNLESIVGGAMLGIGAILAFSGANIPLGIALIAGGIAMTASSALNWNNISDNIKEKLAIITEVVGLSLLAVGSILAFSGVNIPLGIAMMVAGGISLASLGLKWDTLPNEIKTKLAVITKVAGYSLLAIGAILALSGVALPLGLAMMAAGGVTLVKSNGMAVNWDTISENVAAAWDRMKLKLKQKWEDLKLWWKGLKLDGFQIKKPHISWYTTEATGWIAKVLTALGLPASIPHLSVDWYARGGVINGASLVGVGENGAEAIVPLERNTQWISRVAQEMNRQNGYYNDNDSELIVAALYDVANMVVREMRNGDNGGKMSFDRLAKEVTRWQSNAARANGF